MHPTRTAADPPRKTVRGRSGSDDGASPHPWCSASYGARTCPRSTRCGTGGRCLVQPGIAFGGPAARPSPMSEPAAGTPRSDGSSGRTPRRAPRPRPLGRSQPATRDDPARPRPDGGASRARSVPPARYGNAHGPPAGASPSTRRARRPCRPVRRRPPLSMPPRRARPAAPPTTRRIAGGATERRSRRPSPGPTPGSTARPTVWRDARPAAARSSRGTRSIGRGKVQPRCAAVTGRVRPEEWFPICSRAIGSGRRRV